MRIDAAPKSKAKPASNQRAARKYARLTAGIENSNAYPQNRHIEVNISVVKRCQTATDSAPPGNAIA